MTDIGGPLLGSGEDRIPRVVDSGEHHQAGQLGGVGALDIGVQPVADHQRCAELAACHRIPQQCGCRLARNLRFGASSGTQRRHQRPVAGQQAPLGGQRGVDVGCHPQRTGPDGQSGLGQVGPADGHGQPLDDGDGFVVEATHGAQTHGRNFVGQRIGTDDQHRRVRR